jgi:hypothetical protein
MNSGTNSNGELRTEGAPMRFAERGLKYPDGGVYDTAICFEGYVRTTRMGH